MRCEALHPVVGKWAAIALLVATAAPTSTNATTICQQGEAVSAFFAGQVEVDGVAQQCTPSMNACYFAARIASGPDVRTGNYWVNWDDGDTNNRQVHFTQVWRGGTPGYACGGVEDDAGAVDASIADNAMEIPCTILPRLHWEGQDPEWNKEAIESITKEYQPDEVIDGFDWHVILRFNDANRCEQVYTSIETVLKKCMDPEPENCRTHKFIKSLEYVGDDPATRRKTGRTVYKPGSETRRKDEL
eukprot:CAMPEP_0178452024 /NCGR_PEP_ID=MMETSP0689_2-20121128/44010_1 /TAXON_ID=160604 /ORGANISM="Amphidinium massartii, Strain CS-259" /LENGTH=244 /DNA_ID=CAMNT_0020077675 /DNA_START=13 /DNA_END=747 /DNA_ORIENTATION=-